MHHHTIRLILSTIKYKFCNGITIYCSLFTDGEQPFLQHGQLMERGWEHRNQLHVGGNLSLELKSHGSPILVEFIVHLYALVGSNSSKWPRWSSYWCILSFISFPSWLLPHVRVLCSVTILNIELQYITCRAHQFFSLHVKYHKLIYFYQWKLNEKWKQMGWCFFFFLICLFNMTF